jgi:hypothetical protein
MTFPARRERRVSEPTETINYTHGSLALLTLIHWRYYGSEYFDPERRVRGNHKPAEARAGAAHPSFRVMYRELLGQA